MTRPAVAVQGVGKRFASGTVLHAAALEVAPGESVVVLGPSGSGKTTLLRLIAGLEVPESGDIWLEDVHATAPGRILLPPHRRGIGFVFQDLALWPHLTVAGHLRFVMRSRGLPRTRWPQLVDEALALVHIDGYGGRYPHELSGGEQQRVALARALAGSPRLLLLDEPLSSLDADLRAAMRTELSRLRRRLHVTTIVVTHDREDAATLADRVVEMRAGRIVGATVVGREKEGM